MQQQIDLSDGHETTQQRIARLRELSPAAARQLEDALASGVRIEPEGDDEGYFDDYSYEAMLCLWASSLGLAVMAMTETIKHDYTDDQLDSEVEYDDEVKTISHAALIQPYTFDTSSRKLQLLSLDGQECTVSDWQWQVEMLSGVEGRLDADLADRWEIKDMVRDAIFPAEAGILFVDILLGERLPELHSTVHRIAREVGEVHRAQAADKTRFSPIIHTWLSVQAEETAEAAAKAAAQESAEAAS